MLLGFDTYLPSQKAHQVSPCSVNVAGFGFMPELLHPVHRIEVHLLQSILNSVRVNITAQSNVRHAVCGNVVEWYGGSNCHCCWSGNLGR